MAGQNNSGKSNILRFARLLTAGPLDGLGWVDEPQPSGPARGLLYAHHPIEVEDLSHFNQSQQWGLQLIELLMSGPFNPVNDGSVWLRYTLDEPAKRWVLSQEFLSEVVSFIGPAGAGVLSEASSGITSTAGGGHTEDIGRVLERLFPLTPPPVASVDAFRQISNGIPDDDLPDDHSGRNLIGKLAQLERPSTQAFSEQRPKFDAIELFAQSVLEDSTVRIRIPADQSELQVQQGGRVLPLASLGTGIHQVIILATAATILENTLVCIEEPEVHLHPLLQRKLIRYLNRETSNQYLIATHSAHLLDYERAAVLHVTHDPEMGTRVSPASTPQSVADLCADLGYRPSDLIQANAVIWVEGPSDRIYLRHWIEMAAPGEFVEGIHYSIMFYGGALLNHLTANDPSVDEFISLRRLNRHSAILIDSDKSSPHAGISATKVRVRSEFDTAGMPGFAWVTACRTIENYVPEDVLGNAVAAVHARSTFEPPANKWADPLRLTRPPSKRTTVREPAIPESGPTEVRPDKVSIAKHAVEQWPPGELPLDLTERMDQVITFVRSANTPGG